MTGRRRKKAGRKGSRRTAILRTLLLIALLGALVFSSAAALAAVPVSGDTPRVIEVKLKQFGFEPEKIEVRTGETVIFRATSLDVTHGIYIDGYDLYMDVPAGKTVDTPPIKFTQNGKLKMRCATTCGPLHAFMIAEIVVEPNYPFYLSSAAPIFVAGSVLIYLHRTRPGYNQKILGVPIEKEIDITRIRIAGIGKLIDRFLRWRGLHYTLIVPNFFIFMILLSVGFIGNPTGNLNFSIAVVWILWFAAVEFMILFIGRFWCSLCPMPAFGEWLARRRATTMNRARKWFSLNWKWPKKYDTVWPASLFFLGISLFLPWLVTRPVVTAIFFLSLIVMSFALHMIFRERWFCRTICPAGYIGYHAPVSMMGVQSRDKELCAKHLCKECIRGGEKGYGCPWKLYPGGKDWNAYCGYCFECMKSCPFKNMTVKIRMFAKEIANKTKGWRTDEAWWAFIRFSLAIFYELVFFGSYFWIKDWGNMGNPYGVNALNFGMLGPVGDGFVNWLKWVAIVAGVSMAVFPALFYGFSAIAKRAARAKTVTTKETFVAFSYALSPYAQFTWVAFGITLVAVNWAYPINAFLDPAGMGWEPFGIPHFTWMPLFPQWVPYANMTLVLIGLALGLDCNYQIARNIFGSKNAAMRATAVMAPLYAATALLLAWIIMG